MHRGRCENLVEIRDALAKAEEGFAVLLGNFLDQFYSGPSAEALAAEPGLLEGVLEDGGYYDAYLAAVAEYLAGKFGLPLPDWVNGSGRFLATHRVYGWHPKLRELLISECPEPFKRRGVIVSANAMFRV